MQAVVRGVQLLELEFGQAYLWDWGNGLTLVDSGITGSATAILNAITSLGHRHDQLAEIVQRRL